MLIITGLILGVVCIALGLNTSAARQPLMRLAMPPTHLLISFVIGYVIGRQSPKEKRVPTLLIYLILIALPCLHPTLSRCLLTGLHIALSCVGLMLAAKRSL